MKVALLFSGGKDSTLAGYTAKKEKNKIACLITLISENPDSYMFHTPSISQTKKQAEAMGIPLISVETKGEKEKELKDLEKAIKIAIKKYKILGLVTGAVESVYQASRIQKICNKLKIECFNPLWLKDQVELLNELIKNKFEVYIIAVSAEGFSENWLGRKIDKKTIKDLIKLKEEYHISPSGEGGETETFVADAIFFKKKIKILKSEKKFKNYSGIFDMKKLKLIDKK